MLVGEKSNRFHFGISYLIGSSPRNIQISERLSPVQKFNKYFSWAPTKSQAPCWAPGSPQALVGLRRQGSRKAHSLPVAKYTGLGYTAQAKTVGANL